MTLTRRDLLICAGGALAASAMPAWGSAARVLQGPAFGASWTLVAGALPPGLAAAFEEIVRSVDEKMSPFRAGSELSRFNANATTDWQPLSAETCAVVREGLRIAALTGDAFNPTVGPLVGRHGFGPITGGRPGLPGEILARADAVKKARPELSLDLNGIAKGHALDRMVSACRAHGLADFLLEVGGEVFAQGRHPAGRDWQVGVEAANAVRRVATLDGAALATSGTAVNSYLHGGRRYGHIIDPATGRPADTALCAVTVAAQSAMTADALATALFAMGPDKGPAFARDAGVEAFFVLEDGSETATGGFEARLLA